MWGDIKNATLGLLNKFETLLHVLVTALRQTNTDDNGVTHYGPACGGEVHRMKSWGFLTCVRWNKKPVTAKTCIWQLSCNERSSCNGW